MRLLCLQPAAVQMWPYVLNGALLLEHNVAYYLGQLEFAGLENDGVEVEQEQTYILHPMKNFNVYDM